MLGFDGVSVSRARQLDLIISLIRIHPCSAYIRMLFNLKLKVLTGYYNVLTIIYCPNRSKNSPIFSHLIPALDNSK